MHDLHDNDAERALLGAVLQDAKVLSSVRSLIRPDDFYAGGHAKVWDAVLSLDAEGKPVDTLTVSERLHARAQLAAAGGPAYLMALDQDVPLAHNARAYAEIIRDRAQRRKLAAIGRRLQEVAGSLSESPADLQSKASRALASLSSGNYALRSLTDVLHQVFEHVNEVQSERKDPVVPTGIYALDKLIGGLQATLTVVGARTGVGKSAWAATVVENVAQYFAARGRGERVGVISLEDEADWLAYRLLAYRSGVNGFILRYRKKTDAQWGQIGDGAGAMRHYSDQVIVCDQPDLASWEIAQVADDMVINHGVRVLLIDHNNEINHHAHRGLDTLEQKITRSLVDIRSISKRHGIPVVLLCQMTEDGKVKPGQFQGAGGFMHAREIVRKSRVAIELVREPDSDKMGMRVLKHTHGRGQRDVEVEFIGGAAMIRDLEGDQGSLEFDAEKDSVPIHRAAAHFTHDPDKDGENAA